MLGWAEDSETEIVWKQSWVFGVSVHIELLSWCGVLTIFAHHRTPDTKGWLVKHKEFMSFQDFALQSPVSDIDSNKHESCWTEPHDRVLCNGVECNDSATCSHPTERRKMSLSGERKEKDRIFKKKKPSQSLKFGSVSAFRSQVSVQIKTHLFHQHPAKQPATYPAAVCLQGGRIWLSEWGLRAGLYWSGDLWHACNKDACFRCTPEGILTVTIMCPS